MFLDRGLREIYHLHLPAWMQNNVRRGAERIGGQGSAAPDFATLYRIRSWEHGAFVACQPRGIFLSAAGIPAALV
ncbi:MAG: hypothetical protein ACKOLA_09065 [Spartobacteria bacterium]